MISSTILTRSERRDPRPARSTRGGVAAAFATAMAVAETAAVEKRMFDVLKPVYQGDR